MNGITWESRMKSMNSPSIPCHFPRLTHATRYAHFIRSPISPFHYLRLGHRGARVGEENGGNGANGAGLMASLPAPHLFTHFIHSIIRGGAVRRGPWMKWARERHVAHLVFHFVTAVGPPFTSISFVHFCWTGKDMSGTRCLGILGLPLSLLASLRYATEWVVSE